LLPKEEEFALVWSCPPDQAAALMQASDSQFLAGLQRHFGDRAGRFVAVRNRAAFPLTLRFARETVHPRAVLIGNSAQALHPIAGQGFNLGLRDAWTLADLLVRDSAQDPGSSSVLQGYAASRRLDRMAGIVSTDLLTRLFSIPFPLVERVRGIGVALLDLTPPAKRFLMRRMIFGSLP
jgi:2-octaprenyl-6-methoxyphenol hydroxylase